jgi:DNA primase
MTGGHLFQPADIERARTRFDVIAAEVALKRQGRELVGLCPWHNEKTPSFAVVAEKGFAHCQGCGWHGTAIDYVMQRRHLGFVDAVRLLLNLPSLTPKADRAPRQAHAKTDSADAIADARAIWRATEPAGGHVRTYLLSRYLSTTRWGIPEVIREHPALYCRDRALKLPALVAAVHSSADEITAVQRIWLEDGGFEVDESGGDAKGSRLKDVPKKSRGLLGDGAVRLAAAQPVLGFAEGIETALAVRHLHRGMPVWAVLGLARLGYPAHMTEAKNGVPARKVEHRPPSVWVPPEVKHLCIFGDNNPIGRLVAEFAVDWWRWKWRGTGRSVEALFPTLGYGDFQEQLRSATLAGAIR